MPRRLNLQGFARPDILRRIEAGNMLELLAPYREYFADRGVPLAERPKEVDYRKLAVILLASDEETPPHLVEALHVIGNTGVEERIDELLQTAASHGVDTGDGGITPIDLAVRIWLKAPQALEKLEREAHSHRKLKFEHFPARDPAAPMLLEQLPEDLSPLEADLDGWFQEHKRGTGCIIDRLVCGTEVRFIIDHGLPCKRERNRKGRESSPLYYRPETSDLVVCDAVANELRVHASTLGEMRLYVAAFGRHLFGDENHFTFATKYTLEPLQLRGRDALNCRNIYGLETIRLREIQWAWDGAFQHVETHRAADLFLAFAVRDLAIPREATITKAVFEVRLTGIEKPRKLSIRPPNTASFERGEEAALIEQWLRDQEFILVGAKAGNEEADAVMADV